MDADRVGIWGHSYGGYATLLTLIHDDENLFKCGVAGAPVTSWIYYSEYSESIMQTCTRLNLIGIGRGEDR